MLTVALTAAASLREFSPLCLVLPLRGSDTYLASVSQLEALSESLTPVSRSQGIEEIENLEYSFLGFTQEN